MDSLLLYSTDQESEDESSDSPSPKRPKTGLPEGQNDVEKSSCIQKGAGRPPTLADW
jgi:hypothetical protein